MFAIVEDPYAMLKGIPGERTPGLQVRRVIALDAWRKGSYRNFS